LKHGSPGDGHSLQRSHWKRSSPGGHSNSRSHLKQNSPGGGHGRIRSHAKSASPGQGHRRAISQAVLDKPRINRIRPTDFRVKRFDAKPFRPDGGGNFRPMPQGDFKQR
jgi:hypothetical protein